MLRKSTLILCLILTTVRSLSAQTNIIDSLQNIVALQRHDSTELTALLSLANEFLRKDFEKTNAYAHQAITLASIQQNKFRLANGYQYLVTVNQNTGRLDSAEYYLKLLASLSKSGNEKLKISYNQTAGLFYKNQGQFQKALPYMIENLDLLKTENEGRAGQLLNIGNTYKNLGDYQKAVDYHLQALSLFEKLDSKRGQSFCLQSLGNDFFEIKQFKNAQTYYLRSLQLKKELQDRRGIITALIGLGDVNKEFKNYAGSEKYYNNALQEAQEMKLLSDEARCYYQLSLLYQQMDEKEKSLATIVQGLKLARQSGDSTLSAKMNGNLLALKSEKEKESETEFTLLKNLTTLINAGDRSGEAFAYAQLSEHFASKNQYEKAFLYLQKYESLKDSVEGSEVLLQIKNLEEQYQNDKSEKAIELLKKDQQLQALALTRERTNVMLITVALISVVFISGLLINRYRVVNRTKRQLELEKVRNHIARDLHDDIGSTLSSINIISQLGLKGDAQIHLQKIAIHSSQMMDNMSDIVWSINPKNDTFEQVVIRMKEFAFEILEPNEITPSFQLDPALSQQLLTVEKRKNLFLIFKEAINNAAKYSQASKVSISLAVSQGKIHLAILDNGIGFDQNKIFHGNGLMNMKERAIAIGGQLSQKSQPGGGTEIHLEIPVT